jgi:hypothetical protein
MVTSNSSRSHGLTIKRYTSPLLIESITVPRLNTAVMRIRVALGWTSLAWAKNSRPVSPGIC